MSLLRDAYEEVHYASFPRPASAPDRLAAVATMFGLTPPNPATARVLELGCSDGGNLMPLALVTPRAQFVGVDFARSAIARGQQRISDLKLGNIELRAMDVRDFPPDAGAFDYIILHGVFSWVPAEIRGAVLALVGRHLSPHGVAYVDYNTQPGSQLRFLFRDAMRFHVQRFPEPQQQIDQARSLIKLIVDASPSDSLYRAAAEAVLARVSRTPDSALFHEDLSECNEAFYFRDFIAAAAPHDLQYLAEADVWEMNDAFLPPQVRERLTGLRSLVEKEQYLDILRNRAFRQTLLCRKERKVQRALDGSTLETLWFSSDAQAAPGKQADEVCYRAGQRWVNTTNPLAKTVFEALRRAYPVRQTVSELREAARRQHSAFAGSVDAEFLSVLLHAVMSGLVESHSGAAPCATEISGRPLASPLARYQLEHVETLSTLHHRTCDLTSESGRRILPLLDGTRMLEEIAEALGIPETVIREETRSLAANALLLPEPLEHQQ
jgi:methyltransferase-like protein/ubiquinone/menaquinone biosynthesis C-methylase UbiE